MSVTPIIGICATHERVRWTAGWGGTWEQDVTMVTDSYLRQVRSAGAIPVLLAPDPRVAAVPGIALSRVDGLLLAGGVDIDPSNYGAERSDLCETTDAARDTFELALARAALATDVPVLGICRGMQMLNIAAGGTLHQDLRAAGYRNHRPMPGRLDEPTHHDIEVSPGSRVAHLAGPGIQRVNSHHHQGIDRVGAGALVTARSIPDGVIEAIEWHDHRYAIGVQWHPEDGSVGHPIADFIVAAADRRHSSDAEIA